MSGDQGKTAAYERAFQQIAEALRQLPPDQQKTLREQLGNYTHDLKHILGVVTGANALLIRDSHTAGAYGDLLEIIQRSAGELDDHFEILIQNLSTQIGLDE
jgi:signal transduction histidine kinase